MRKPSCWESTPATRGSCSSSSGYPTQPHKGWRTPLLQTSIFFPSIKRLNEQGARKFVVSDVGQLGCIPYVRALEIRTISWRRSFCTTVNTVRFSSSLLPANDVLQTSEHEMAILRIQFLLCINTSGRYLSWLCIWRTPVVNETFVHWLHCLVLIMRRTRAAAAASLRSSALAQPNSWLFLVNFIALMAVIPFFDKWSRVTAQVVA